MKTSRAAVLLSALGTLACHEPNVTSTEPRLATSADPTASARHVLEEIPVPVVHPVLGDPRLSAAHEAAQNRDWVAAARALTTAEAALTPDARTPSEKCAWAYVAGRFYLLANQYSDAVLAFDRVVGSADAGTACPLTTHATLHAAEAYLKLGDFPAADGRARRIPEASSIHDDAELLLASALAGEQRLVDAIVLWRKAVEKNPKVWIDVALPLATALLDLGGAEADAHAVEALDLTTRFVVEAPRIAETSGAEALRQRAWAKVALRDPKAPRDLTLAQRARQARVWLDGSDVVKAAALATALLKDAALAKDAALLCTVSIVRAQALGRTKAGPGDAWDDAIARCEHDDALVTALYSGAKAAAGKHPDIAAGRYAKVEELFPKHRLADDARFQGALLALGLGDDARFTKMMLALPDDYPDGDQKTEALFRVSLLRMTRGDWAGSADLLDRIAALSPDDQHWATAGRAEYFRARVAAHAGQRDDARERYLAILLRHPFAYYMSQAYARLSDDDPGLATRALGKAFAREETAPFLTSRHKELSAPATEQARALLEAGDIELAKRELSAAGVFRDDAPVEVTWTLALLYEQAGAPELGRSLVRQKLHDYLGHYPVGAWRTKWEIAYPRAFEELVVRDSRDTRIPAALTWAIMREESDFVPEAKSSSNAFGLMQLIIPTARGVARGTGFAADEASLKQPAVSIALGTKLLAQLRGTFVQNPPLAIAAYNGGGGAVSRWLSARGDEDFDLWVEEIPWEETRGYTKRVLSSEAAYAYLYDPSALDEVLRTASRARGAGATAVATPGDAGAVP
jgi:soluble lytic murein transglycosylase